MDKFPNDSDRLTISLATEQDRARIYQYRHDIYARELGQHAENPAGQLSDSLDSFNTYISASVGGNIVGFISVTPPNRHAYSIDKYISRAKLPFQFDEQLHEIRLLTVVKPHRGRPIAGLLMYAALRWVETHGGVRIIALGRREVLEIYLKVGLQPVGRQIQAGAVTYELLSATTSQIRQRLVHYDSILRKLEKKINWQLDLPFRPLESCYHGGDFFEAIGDEFDRLEKSRYIINADVLDAWYPPSPKVLNALQEYLPWLLRTSPPTRSQGLIKTIARVRGVDPRCILPGAGSSDLIFLALREWLRPMSRVLILDPTYGEYPYLLEEVIGCRVDRLVLSRRNDYQPDLAELASRLDIPYDLIILVNPNSPTGRHVPRQDLESFLKRVPARTRIWIDETYIEYAGPNQSLESFAARSENVIVSKSMSKVYALSGVRVAYLCGPAALIAKLRVLTPPWAVSLPAQVAAIKALEDPDYYTACYNETHRLRQALTRALLAVSPIEIIPGVANFLFCHLPPTGPDAATVVGRCQAVGLFVRNTASMGSQLGRHTLRVAVKEAETNDRMVGILSAALNGLTTSQITTYLARDK